MTIEEKVKKMNEMLTEVNNLAKEINEEINKERTGTADMLSIYINNMKSSLSQYWVDSDGKVRSGTTEYRPDDYNPYCNYNNRTYAEKAARMKKFTDMLLAFKWCYDRDYEPNWSAEDDKYFVAYDFVDGHYYTTYSVAMSYNVVYFSSEDIALKCADWLNQIDPEGVLVLGTRAMDK